MCEFEMEYYYDRWIPVPPDLAIKGSDPIFVHVDVSRLPMKFCVRVSLNGIPCDLTANG